MSAAADWKIISSKTHFANRHLEVVTEEICTPACPEARAWTVARRKAAVVIAPMTREGKLVLIRQERIPIRGAILEMPAGQIDDALAGLADPDDSVRPGSSAPATTADLAAIERVARRELREETGYQLATDGEMIPLGYFFSSPGFTDEYAYFLLARPVEPAAESHTYQDSESILDCRSFAPDEIRRLIAENEIRDANTLSICARLLARGFLTWR